MGMLHVHACVDQIAQVAILPFLLALLHGGSLCESLAAGGSNYLLACGTRVLFSYGSGLGRPPLVPESRALTKKGGGSL